MAELGRPWALATGYDIAFLHLIMAILEQAPVERLSCTALPFRKLSVRRLSPDSRRWLAAVNMLLIEEKCRDDLADEGGLKARLGLRLVRNQAARAREVVSESGFSLESISTLSKRQTELEARSLPLEHYALPTSLVLGEIFTHASKMARRPDLESSMRQLGQGLGAAIYIKDSLDDLPADKKFERFNGLISGGHEPSYGRAALARELERARNGLSRMGMDNPEVSLVLEQLSNGERRSQEPRSFPLRRRKVAGYCDCACDCGACDCGACGDCGACDSDCGACCDCTDCVSSCSSCPCDGCFSCSNSNSSSGGTHTASAVSATPPTPRLHCPACGGNLKPNDLGQVEIDECPRCNGLWLDHGELEQLVQAKNVPARLLRTKSTKFLSLRPEGTRPCPRCSKILVGTVVKGVRLDLCSDCQGLWLDQGELNDLLLA